ncbi:MAG: 50S ribosomal protein L29 [Clostridia bacterium]
MKTDILYGKTNDELELQLNELKSELFYLRFKHATNQLTNPMVLVNCKKDIARVKTILRQRELNISVEPQKAAKKTAKKAK